MARFNWYARMLLERPLATKTVTGGVLAFVGDIGAQKVNHQLDPERQGSKFSLDYRRLAVFTAFGAVWTGPVNHVWLRWLSHRFPIEQGVYKSLLPKLALHHGILNPLVYLPGFFVFTGALMGQTPTEIQTKMENEYPDRILAVWGTWIPTTAILFQFCPERYQSVAMAVVSLGWNTYLSAMSLNDPERARKIEEENSSNCAEQSSVLLDAAAEKHDRKTKVA